MITEHLMRPGSGDVRFGSGVPVSVTEAIRALVDENAGGVGASLVITPVRVDPDQIGDAATLAAASYFGPIIGRESRLSLQVAGLLSWLDTYLDTTVNRTSGTPTQMVGDLLANGLTTGTVTGGSNVSRVFPAHSVSRREALDAWVALANCEYRVNPDLTVDVAAASTLFVSPPEVVVTRKDEGVDGPLRGVEGSMLDQALTMLGPNIATRAVALTQGDGATILKGTANRSVSLKTPTGGTPAIVTVLSAPSEESANANTVASNFLNLQGMRRSVSVSSRTFGLPRFVKPGDEVYIWDPASGLFDTANQVIFRGETIHPMLVRLLSYSWPIERGMGVYVRPNAATPAYIDVTDWVDWETGDTWWTVGDWSPPSYGPTNRTNPEIEQRVAGGKLSGTYTPTLSGMAIGTGGSAANTASWSLVGGLLTVTGIITFGTSGTTFPGTNINVTLPPGYTMDTSFTVRDLGHVLFNDAGTASFGGVCSYNSNTSVRFIALNAAGTYLSRVATGTTIPFTWAAGDQIGYQFTVPVSPA